MKKFILPALILFLIATGCEQKNCCVLPDEQVMEITGGTSFGECFGYCATTVNFELAQLSFERFSLVESDDFPPKSCEFGLTSSEWAQLKESVDLSYFFEIEETIGCPDCDDSGSEWIEIKSYNRTHRVTFEFGESVTGLEDLLVQVRDFREDLSQRTSCQ